MKSLTIHHTEERSPDTSVPDTHQDVFSKTILGFWVYLMSDCIIFAVLFLTYEVLKGSTFGGPGPKELFHISTAFIETMILLFSSFACGMGMLAAKKSKKQALLAWLFLSFAFGASFIALEYHEFATLLSEGHSWKNSAFLSAFFTLVGTHGLHVSVGLFWLLNVIAQVSYQGINVDTFRRVILFGMFWHFLDLVWIFIFTFVYLLGVI